jgi:hypothetical protein
MLQALLVNSQMEHIHVRRDELAQYGGPVFPQGMNSKTSLDVVDTPACLEHSLGGLARLRFDAQRLAASQHLTHAD